MLFCVIVMTLGCLPVDVNVLDDFVVQVGFEIDLELVGKILSYQKFSDIYLSALIYPNIQQQFDRCPI